MCAMRSSTTGMWWRRLKDKGARFVEELDEVPDGAVTVFSAHGVPQAVVNDAQRRGLPVLDATCPLVSKVHSQGKRYVGQGRTLILIGHAGHPEVEGTMGQVGAPDPSGVSPRRMSGPGHSDRHRRWPMSPRPPSASTTPGRSSRR